MKILVVEDETKTGDYLRQGLMEAGFVVALPRHRGDNHMDPSTPGPQSWRLRPAEVLRSAVRPAQNSKASALGKRSNGPISAAIIKPQKI